MKYQILIHDYKIIPHPKTRLPYKVYRILALRSFLTALGEVKEGSIGGFISGEHNLSHDDTAWVYHMGMVFDDALIIDSIVTDDAAVFESAIVRDSEIGKKARVFGQALVTNSLITDNVDVCQGTTITDSEIFNACSVMGKSKVVGSVLMGGVRVTDHSEVVKSTLSDTVEVGGKSYCENCVLSGRTVVYNERLINATLSRSIDMEVRSGIDPND
mgnify:CR=1 FL=1